MTNTYAINVTRGKEFAVEADLSDLGLHPWVPKALASRYIKEKRQYVWYDRPYVSKLMFCVIPAIYYRDVINLKHVIGKPLELSQWDIDGRADGTPGLRQFQDAVKREYDDMARRRDISGYECQYTPGQALELLTGALQGLSGTFRAVVRRAYDDYPRLKVDVDMFGRATTVEVDPDHVSVAK